MPTRAAYLASLDGLGCLGFPAGAGGMPVAAGSSTPPARNACRERRHRRVIELPARTLRSVQSAPAAFDSLQARVRRPS